MNSNVARQRRLKGGLPQEKRFAPAEQHRASPNAGSTIAALADHASASAN
jgi:hypothetical protein